MCWLYQLIISYISKVSKYKLFLHADGLLQLLPRVLRFPHALFQDPQPLQPPFPDGSDIILSYSVKLFLKIVLRRKAKKAKKMIKNNNNIYCRVSGRMPLWSLPCCPSWHTARANDMTRPCCNKGEGIFEKKKNRWCKKSVTRNLRAEQEGPLRRRRRHASAPPPNVRKANRTAVSVRFQAMFQLYHSTTLFFSYKGQIMSKYIISEKIKIYNCRYDRLLHASVTSMPNRFQ